MPPSTEPGQRIEILFTEAGCIMELDVHADDPDVTGAIVAAIEADDPDDAERALRAGIGTNAEIRRRP